MAMGAREAARALAKWANDDEEEEEEEEKEEEESGRAEGTVGGVIRNRPLGSIDTAGRRNDAEGYINAAVAIAADEEDSKDDDEEEEDDAGSEGTASRADAVATATEEDEDNEDEAEAVRKGNKANAGSSPRVVSHCWYSLQLCSMSSASVGIQKREEEIDR